MNLFCDGFADCKDGTDEPAGCGGSCRSTEKRCRFAEPREYCLLKIELFIYLNEYLFIRTVVYLKLNYLFRNGRCVASKTFCDGINTCGDNSDEEHCNGVTMSRLFASTRSARIDRISRFVKPVPRARAVATKLDFNTRDNHGNVSTVNYSLKRVL